MNSDQPDWLQIARERITIESLVNTGYLDLKIPELQTFPDELSCLTALKSLDCSGTQIRDLSLLSCLSSLQSLDCFNTQITDLSPLSGLTALQSLDCSYSRITDLSPLSGLTALQSLDFSNTKVTELSPLAGLTALQSLSCFKTPLTDLSPLSSLTDLLFLSCFKTPLTDLSPLSSLKALQSLNCSFTKITDLSPLSGLTALQSLDCYGTKITDLSPLSGFTALQSLECRKTQITDLLPLAGLTALQSLQCSNTQITDLSPLSGLTALQSLQCSNTQITDLSPLSGLTALQSLQCSNTQITDLSPLSGLTALQSLQCSNTQITDLSPLSGLTALQSLQCYITQITDLSPLSELLLYELSCSNCKLKQIPKRVWNMPSLRELYLYQTQLPSIPTEVLSQDYRDNCLSRLRSHLFDLEAGSETINEVKLILLGNGRVGKTQICRRLSGKNYDETVESTHGILLNSTKLKQSDGTELAQINIWDFGGQDIYHGTHALFLNTRAIFLIVWAPGNQSGETDKFRNYPPDYWLTYVRCLGNPNSPVFIVQTRCDRPEDEIRILPLSENELNGFPFLKFLHYSSFNDRGRAALDEALREAVVWQRQQQGLFTLGVGRLRVQRRLEALRESDQMVPPVQRKYRIISQESFRAFCEESGGVSSPEHCLEYLHHTGVVFYRKGLFGEGIVLDQSWVFEGIYAVFNRDGCNRELKRLGGRFSRSLLELLVWRNYSKAEQLLFLDMMQSCGICFVHKDKDIQLGTESEYIAPELLPSKETIQSELSEKWNPSEPYEEAVFRYELHQPALLRSLMAVIGQKAGGNGLYWKEGICVFESSARSHALIEQETGKGWSGIIRIRTQGGRANELLDLLIKLVTNENNQWNLKPLEKPVADSLAIDLKNKDLKDKQEPDFEFTQDHKPGKEYCVSYAWGDETEEGKERGLIVEKLCQHATNQGIRILRDTQDLNLGDQLSRFMNRIGQGDRVFVIISDKYLKSNNCMYELFEIWRNSRQESEEFLQRVCIYSTACAHIFSVRDRLSYAIYWKDEHESVKKIISEHGPEILGEKDFKAFKRMDEFASHVSEILATVADVIHARNFDDLIHEFDLE